VSSLYSHLRLTADGRRELLAGLVARSSDTIDGRRPLLVFDLDGTLLDNRPRVVAILHELAQSWRESHPEAAAKVARARDEDIGYGLVDNLMRLGIEVPELHAAGQRFWFERFFIDEYLRHDTALAGAVEFARRCHEAGASIMYLTGRDLPKMAVGTLASLRDLGFPIGVVGTSLVTKPAFDIPDERFKREVARELDRVGPVLAVFDNEPGNCNALLEAHPACVSVLLDTQHAPNPPALHSGVVVIDTFEA